MSTPTSEEDNFSDNQESFPAESGSKPSKLELWKKAPSDFLAEAVARSSDETRAEVARNMRVMLQEKEDGDEEKNRGLETREWKEIKVWLTESHLQCLKEQARNLGITPSKKARLMLESYETERVEEDSQTKNWQKTSVFIHEEMKQDLQDTAEEKEIDLQKEASIRLQEALTGEEA